MAEDIKSLGDLETVVASSELIVDKYVEILSNREPITIK